MTQHPEPELDLWNKRYQNGEHPRRNEPADLLLAAVDWLPDGRALDVATGTGRHALFLAERGYTVDAIDISDVGLTIARSQAKDRGLSVNWIQAALETFVIPQDRYDVVTVVGYYNPSILPDLKAALTVGGVLLYEHHLGPAAIADRGPGDEYRFSSNELLDACGDLTVLDYRERLKPIATDENDEAMGAFASIIARNGCDGEPWYPPTHQPPNQPA